MKRVLPGVGLFLVLCGAASAQVIGATWQGMVPGADHERVAVRLYKAEDGQLHGALYEIDKGPGAAALSSAAVDGAEVRFAQGNLDVSYEGKLSADGKSIVGTWTRNKQAFPLTLELATAATMWKRSGPSAPTPMAATADPAFEVATIKPSPPDAKGYSYALRTRDFTAKNRSVKDLMEFAYQVRDRQVSGGPAWMTENRFDLAGRPDAEGVPSADQYRLMIRKLLASRFHLQVQSVKRTFPVYALVREEKAPQLAQSDPDMPSGNIYVREVQNGQMELHFVGFTMPEFADLLMNFISERQVVDETGLSGSFELTLLLPASVMKGGGNAGPDDRPDAFRQALKQLGMKLVAKEESIKVLVVQHVEMPTEN